MKWTRDKNIKNLIKIKLPCHLIKKLIWSGLGWVMGGPIGAILGYAFASMDKNSNMNWKN